MAEKLQALLDKIKSDGLDKAEAEKTALLSDAQEQANKIIKEAESKAEKLRKKAQADAEQLEAHAKAALTQAARDVVIKLKQDLQTRLENIIRSSGDATMTPAFMAELIGQMADKFNAVSDEKTELEVLVPEKKREELSKLLTNSVVKDLIDSAEVFGDKDLRGGFKVGIKNSDVFFDFSDEAVMALIYSYVSPKLAEMFKRDSE